MAIVFPSSYIEGLDSRVNIKDHVIQFVDYTATVSAAATTAAWVPIMTNAITTTKAGNRILVEYMCNHRNDFGQGAWCLSYHRMLVTNSAAGITDVQVMYSGHMGGAALHIGHYERQFMYTAATQGTYTFTASVLAFQGTSNYGTANSGSTNHYLRLYEVGS